jgi:hypothetical protein
MVKLDVIHTQTVTAVRSGPGANLETHDAHVSW